MSIEEMLNQEVTNKGIALDMIFTFLQIAQRRGAFTFRESSKIYECIQQFDDMFEKPQNEEEEPENSDEKNVKVSIENPSD